MELFFLAVRNPLQAKDCIGAGLIVSLASGSNLCVFFPPDSRARRYIFEKNACALSKILEWAHAFQNS